MTAPTTTPTDLSAALQDTLVELIDLSLQAKHYHWNVTGQEFRGVHLHLDEITDQVRETIQHNLYRMLVRRLGIFR